MLRHDVLLIPICRDKWRGVEISSDFVPGFPAPDQCCLVIELFSDSYRFCLLQNPFCAILPCSLCWRFCQYTSIFKLVRKQLRTRFPRITLRVTLYYVHALFYRDNNFEFQLFLKHVCTSYSVKRNDTQRTRDRVCTAM